MTITDWRAFTSILNMQINPWRPCYIRKLADFLNQDNPSQHVGRDIWEDLMNIGDWRAFTSILDMQISAWRPCLLCKLVVFRTQTRESIRGCSEKKLRRSDEYRRLGSVTSSYCWVELGGDLMTDTKTFSPCNCDRVPWFSYNFQ